MLVEIFSMAADKRGNWNKWIRGNFAFMIVGGGISGVEAVPLDRDSRRCVGLNLKADSRGRCFLKWRILGLWYSFLTQKFTLMEESESFT